MNEIEQVILSHIERTNKVVKQQSQAYLDQLGVALTIDQWMLLNLLDEHENISQKELAKLSQRDTASINRSIKILVNQGFVNKETLRNDLRKQQISLSNVGKYYLHNHSKMIEKTRKKFLEGFFPQEMELLRSFLERIQKNATVLNAQTFN